MTTSVKPVAGDDTYTFADTQTISGNMLSNDLAGANGKLYLRDFDGDDVLAKIAGQVTDIIGQYGTFRLQADGTWSYTLSDAAKVGFYAGMSLTETMQYKISDGAGHTDVGIFSLTVEATMPKPAPVDHFTTSLTLNFDDIVTHGNGVGLPNDYHGFSLTAKTLNVAVFQDSAANDLGMSTVSQEPGGNVAFNPGGFSPIVIEKTDHSDFDFISGVFANALQGGQSVVVSGWSNGVEIYESTLNLSDATATHFAANWLDVDQVQITSSTGTPFQIAFDDLQFHV